MIPSTILWVLHPSLSSWILSPIGMLISHSRKTVLVASHSQIGPFVGISMSVIPISVAVPPITPLVLDSVSITRVKAILMIPSHLSPTWVSILFLAAKRLILTLVGPGHPRTHSLILRLSPVLILGLGPILVPAGGVLVLRCVSS